jgi:hypothetical protein|tara:strand:+ start:32 stop:271 length:240 start_codon:yes stop_codon:yes gene_type:complete
MQISITIQDAKFIKKVLTVYQRQHLNVETLIRQSLKDHPEKFTDSDLSHYENAIVGIYETGFVADRLDELIRDAEESND